jgi:hypothetical protein
MSFPLYLHLGLEVGPLSLFVVAPGSNSWLGLTLLREHRGTSELDIGPPARLVILPPTFISFLIFWFLSSLGSGFDSGFD